MIALFLSKYWKEMVIGALISFCVYFIYNNIYERGFEKANAEHVAYIKEYNSKLDTRIQTLEDFSRVIYEQNEQTKRSQLADNQKILALARKEPLVIYKEGKCTLSPTFVDSYNSVIDRANQK